ncbi:PREDICTED: CD83 antigen [Crocodylus porosus]|uniref:CD83 molecule n=1 Tax=Crocodylus porosus TaxID=8502 RepID=A0A7M4E3Y3_CROPO|nr:PREDICTED: CD83 antigen [Crocodylus porosus]
MPSVYYTQLVILSNVWCLIHGAPQALSEIVVTCGEEALLPCQAPQDLQVTYTAVSWQKVAENCKELTEMVQDNCMHEVKYYDLVHLNESLEISNYSLRIKNTTSHNSGIYKCTLRESTEKHNESGTVSLKITDCPEDEKFKKYKTELLLLTCLGIFYLLLIIFTCKCLRKESLFSDYQKGRRGKKHTLTLVSAQEMMTFQHLDSSNTGKNGLNWSSV